jgi:hypothetical protein
LGLRVAADNTTTPANNTKTLAVKSCLDLRRILVMRSSSGFRDCLRTSPTHNDIEFINRQDHSGLAPLFAATNLLPLDHNPRRRPAFRTSGEDSYA